MLTIKELRLKNIGRFVTEQVVNFDELGSLVQVDGENRNTAGSSGSGKSTFFNALDYLLGLNDLPVTVLQSRLTKEGIHVVGIFDWDGKQVELVRGKGKLSISIDGVLAEGSAKMVEEKIDEILGLSRELFRPILHKRQKEGGFFLKMTPAKVHEFLTSVLNLGEYQKKLDKLDTNLKTYANAKVSYETALTGARSALKATQDAILSLGLAPIRDMHQAVVLDLKNKADVSNAKLQLVIANHDTQNKILDSQRPILPEMPVIPKPVLEDQPFDRTAWDTAVMARSAAEQEVNRLLDEERIRQKTINQAIQERKLSLSTLNYKVTLANTAKNEATKLAAEIKKIRESICPTCEQSWANDAAKAKEAELLAKLTAFRVQINDGIASETAITNVNMEVSLLEKELVPQYHPRLPDLNAEIANHSSAILAEKAKFDAHQAMQSAANKKLLDQYNAEHTSAMAAYHANTKALNDDFATKQQALRWNQNLELDQARGQADVDRMAFEAAVNKLKAFEAANTRYTTSLESLKKQEEQYDQKVVEINQMLVNTEVQLVIAEETKRAIKSYMSCSFDEALEEVGDAATRIIRSIPNMANSTIQFQGIRETQAGKIKEEVNAVISMDGEEGIDIRSLSGGERSSADLAIDLAVIDLIENRSNKGISVFVLDEPFTGLDTVSIEMVLEVLKNTKLNKKLIIVDHNPEVKEMVESRLVVVREGLTSNILQ